MADFAVMNAGSIFIVHPKTDAAEAWVDERVPERQTFGKGFAVEPRYVAELVAGMTCDGFTIESLD